MEVLLKLGPIVQEHGSNCTYTSSSSECTKCKQTGYICKTHGSGSLRISQTATASIHYGGNHSGSYGDIRYLTCSKCASPGYIYRKCTVCGQEWVHDNALKCTDCDGTGTINKCSHGYTASTPHCEHGKTSQHD